MKKLIAAVTTGLIAIALVLVGAAAPASAHTATFTGNAVCNSSTGGATITWTIDNDYPLVATVTASTSPTVIPVNTTVDATSGHGDTQKAFTQDIPAPAAGVSTSITLSFKWSDGFTQNNTTATAKVSSDCAAKDASASITDTPASCGAAETAAENTATIANATWATPQTSGSTWTAVATAVSGHQFTSAGTDGHLSSNNTVDTFTVHLSNATNPNDCKDAAAALVFTAATCNGPETVVDGALTDATWSTPVSVNGLTYSAVATAKSGFEFPSGANVTNGGTTLTLTGSLNPQLTGHPCEDFTTVAWYMPSWDNSSTPTWTPFQTYTGISQETSTPQLNVLDSRLTERCGVQYQVDIYYNSPETTALLAAGALYGPNDGGTIFSNENLPEDLWSGTWLVGWKLIQGPACATPVTPTETDTCGNGGTITITPAEGVIYYVNGTAVDTSGGTANVSVGDGTNTVTAVAQTGYLLTGYPDGGWTFNIDTDCTATYNTSGVCTSGDSGSTETVSITFDNPSSTDATFVVTSSDSTVNSPNSYLVPAGTSETEVVGSTGTSGGTFEVSINGGTAIEVDAPSFTGCINVVPVKPDANPVTTCDVTGGGSVDITPTVGIDYYLDGTQVTSGASWVDQAATTGLTGKVHVTAVAESGYVIEQGATSHWWFWLGKSTDCTVTPSYGDCVATNGVSNESVTLTFTNPAKDDAVVDVTGGSISGTLEFDVPAGATDFPYVVDTNGVTGDVYDVSINGVAQTPIDLSFEGCLPVNAGDPFVTQATCNGDNQTANDNASLTVDLEAGLSYTITGPAGFTTLTNITGTGGDTVVASGIPAGDYVVSVAALPGYTLNLADPDSWPFHVTLPSLVCDFGVTISPAQCTPDITLSKISATTEQLGSITTEANADVVYTATNTSTLVQTVLTNGGTTFMDDGTYTVAVTLSAQGVTDGVVLGGNTSFGPYTFTNPCLPTEASWDAGVTPTNATCTATSAVDGTLDLLHDADQTGDVTYKVVNDATSAVVYDGTNSVAGDTIIHVAPGTYTVTAIPLSGDGISGAAPSPANPHSNPDGSATFNPITIDAIGTDCDGNLAFTGGTIAWLGFVLAGGMLFLGFALLYMRRRGNRTAE